MALLIQRDYVLRLIEQAGAALRRALDRAAAGEHREALAGLRGAQETLLADLGPMARVLAPDSLVELAGRETRPRLVQYARLVAAEARVHLGAGDTLSAALAARRAAALFSALAAAGESLEPADEQTMGALAAELGPL